MQPSPLPSLLWLCLPAQTWEDTISVKLFASVESVLHDGVLDKLPDELEQVLVMLDRHQHVDFASALRQLVGRATRECAAAKAKLSLPLLHPSAAAYT